MSTESPSFKKVAQGIATSLNNFVDWQTAMDELRVARRAFETYRGDIDVKFQRADERISGIDSRFSSLDMRVERLDRFRETTESRCKELTSQIEDIRTERTENERIRKLTDRIEALEVQLKEHQERLGSNNGLSR
jgi:chromosome segregation ATPase